MNDMTLNWYKSIKNRTSVSDFSDTVDQKTFTELKKFAAGLNNDEARLSPSALNKQPWELDIKEDSIELINNSNNWGFGGVDCGIAMLHLELGAEFRGVFGEWKFKDGAPVFIPLPQSANCHDESEAYDEEDAYNDEFRYEGSSSADDAADSDIPNVEVESSYNFNIG